MSNIRTDPEDFGLTIAAQVDFIGGYDFDIVALFRNSQGEFFIAADSGCSCPIPFEDITLQDLRPVRSVHDVMEFLRDPDYRLASVLTTVDFIERCDKAMSRGTAA